MQLSIIIVNYNVKYFLEQCLLSVMAASKNIIAEIIVVDNFSTDGSRLFFNNRFTNVRFIWLQENTGFSKASNLGLLSANGSTILFLNPDTIVPEDCFEQCLIFLHSQANPGALGIHMIDGNGKFLKESKRGFPSLFTSCCKLSGLSALFPTSKIFANYYLGHLEKYKNHTVDILAGAFMMVDKKVLEKVGGFDETFFMYAEDIDLSYRIQNAGYTNYYFAESTILHFKGESTKKETLQYLRRFYGAMLIFVKKHSGKISSSIYSVLIQLAIAVKAIVIPIKNLFKKSVTETGKKITAGNAVVVSDAETFQTIYQSLQQHFSTVERLQQSSEAAAVSSVVIMCNPFVSFKDIIFKIQHQQGLYQYYIHAAGSKSMVGSDDKNSNGVTIDL